MSAGEVKTSANELYQEVLEKRVLILAYQGEQRAALTLYQELPSLNPQLLEEVEEVLSKHEALSRVTQELAQEPIQELANPSIPVPLAITPSPFAGFSEGETGDRDFDPETAAPIEIPPPASLGVDEEGSAS